MGSFLDYSKGFNAALVQMFANYGFNSSVGPVQFPPTPVFSDLPDDFTDNMDDDDPK